MKYISLFFAVLCCSTVPLSAVANSSYEQQERTYMRRLSRVQKEKDWQHVKQIDFELLQKKDEAPGSRPKLILINPPESVPENLEASITYVKPKPKNQKTKESTPTLYLGTRPSTPAPHANTRTSLQLTRFPQPVLTQPISYTPTVTRIKRPVVTNQHQSIPTTEEFLTTVLRLTNAQRKAHGLLPLRRNANLDRSAFAHAKDMSNNSYFSHISLDGRTPSDRINASGYFSINYAACACLGWDATIAENIAQGQHNAHHVVNDWMNSAIHRGNILSNAYTEIGLAKVGTYWVQNFGNIELQYGSVR